MATVFPRDVRRQPEQHRLRILWEDGLETTYDYDTLRGYCPCAGCQGHLVREIVFHRPPRPVEPRRIEPVGNYAISIAWSDGHATGIYRFDFLRELASRNPPPAGSVSQASPSTSARSGSAKRLMSPNVRTEAASSSVIGPTATIDIRKIVSSPSVSRV